MRTSATSLFILHFLPPISNPLISSSLPFLPWYSVYSTPPFISTANTQMKLPAFAAILLLLTRSSTVQSFTIITNGVHNNKHPSATIIHKNKYNTRCTSYYSSPLRMTIVSPFDNSTDDASADESVATATYTPLPSDDEPLDLTWDNVEAVLDEMRPYLLQDGGNVVISEIDGPIVRLELVVRCMSISCSTHFYIPYLVVEKVAIHLNITFFLFSFAIKFPDYNHKNN